jgi:lipopolysaccharide transport system permease protein
MFISPVVYPSELVPRSFRALYGVNPVAGVLELGRWSVFGSAISSLPMLLTSLVAASALLLAGVHYFRSHEHLFADVI